MDLGSLDTTSGWSLFTLLLVFLFWLCIINALSRFISQQVQWIKYQILRNTHLCLCVRPPSNSIGGLWRLGRSTISITPISHCPIVSRKQLDKSLPLSPTAVGYLSQEGTCWVWGPKGEMNESGFHLPWRALWVLQPEKEIHGLISLHSCTLKRGQMTTLICYDTDKQNVLKVVCSVKGQTY
jgi:hypothetical protein